MEVEKCGYCGSTEEPFHRDHIIPSSRGGGDEADNSVRACATCNGEKSDLTPSEWRPKGLPAWIYEVEKKLLKRYRLKSKSKRGPKPPKKIALVDKFFLSRRPDGKIEWKGYVIDEVPPDRLLVRLFSWMTGYPTEEKVVEIAQTSSWSFFDSDEDMYAGYLRAKHAGLAL